MTATIQVSGRSSLIVSMTFRRLAMASDPATVVQTVRPVVIADDPATVIPTLVAIVRLPAVADRPRTVGETM
jgi:hypothetical protein